MRDLLKQRSAFVASIALYASDDLSPEQKREVEQLFTMDHGGIVAYCNNYMEQLIESIKNKKLSLDGFTREDGYNFSLLLNNEKLSLGLRTELSHLIYGADERAKYFD